MARHFELHQRGLHKPALAPVHFATGEKGRLGALLLRIALEEYEEGVAVLARVLTLLPTKSGGASGNPD